MSVSLSSSSSRRRAGIDLDLEPIFHYARGSSSISLAPNPRLVNPSASDHATTSPSSRDRRGIASDIPSAAIPSARKARPAIITTVTTNTERVVSSHPLTGPSNHHNIASATSSFLSSSRSIAFAASPTRPNAEAGPSKPRLSRVTGYKGTYTLPPLSSSPTTSSFPLGQSHHNDNPSAAGSTSPQIASFGAVLRSSPAKKQSTAGRVWRDSDAFPELSDRVLHRWQRDGLRPVSCAWGQCDAVLASWALFEKHLDLHVDRESSKITVENDDERHGTKSTPITLGSPVNRPECRFGRCSSLVASFGTGTELKGHVAREHVPVERGRSWCPLKDCDVKLRGSLRAHLESHHSTLAVQQIKDSLRPNAESPLILSRSSSSTRPTRAMPDLPPLPKTYPVHLLSYPAVLRGQKLSFNQTAKLLAMQAEEKNYPASREFRVAFGFLPRGNLADLGEDDLMTFRDSADMWPDLYIDSSSIGEHRPIPLKQYRPMPCEAGGRDGKSVFESVKRTAHPTPDITIKRRKLDPDDGGSGVGRVAGSRAPASIGIEVYERRLRRARHA